MNLMAEFVCRAIGTRRRKRAESTTKRDIIPRSRSADYDWTYEMQIVLRLPTETGVRTMEPVVVTLSRA